MIKQSQTYGKSSERTNSDVVVGCDVPFTALVLLFFDNMEKQSTIKNLDGEIWKPIVGFEGFYEVSNMGRAKSLNYNHTKQEHLLKPQLSGNYFQIPLRKNGKIKRLMLNRAVYEAFHEKLPEWRATMKSSERMEVNHKDENKLNNRLDNLELITGLENINYGNRNKRLSESKTNGKKSKKVYQYTQNGDLVEIFPSTRECERSGFCLSCISACCRNEYTRKNTNIYKGYIWSYTPLNIESF